MGRGSRVARFAYFIEATHKWHLSKHIFHTYPTHTLTHICRFSLLPSRIARGQKSIFQVRHFMCAKQRQRVLGCLCVYVFVCVAIELGTLRLGVNKSEWGKGRRTEKVLKSKALELFCNIWTRQVFKVNMSLAGRRRPDHGIHIPLLQHQYRPQH